MVKINTRRGVGELGLERSRLNRGMWCKMLVAVRKNNELLMINDIGS
jgi:hypothetical protein